MDHIKILTAILVVSMPMLIGTCVSQPPAPKTVGITLNIPVSYTLNINPTSLDLTGNVPGSWSGSTVANIFCNNADGFYVYANMSTSSLGHLRTPGGQALVGPLNITLPGGTISSLPGPVIQNYLPGDRSGTISFQQGVVSRDIAGTYTGQVTIGLTLSLPPY